MLIVLTPYSTYVTVLYVQRGTCTFCLPFRFIGLHNRGCCVQSQQIQECVLGGACESWSVAINESADSPTRRRSLPYSTLMRRGIDIFLGSVPLPQFDKGPSPHPPRSKGLRDLASHPSHVVGTCSVSCAHLLPLPGKKHVAEAHAVSHLPFSLTCLEGLVIPARQPSVLSPLARADDNRL
jgi:hypothetical protein